MCDLEVDATRGRPHHPQTLLGPLWACGMVPHKHLSPTSNPKDGNYGHPNDPLQRVPPLVRSLHFTSPPALTVAASPPAPSPTPPHLIGCLLSCPSFWDPNSPHGLHCRSGWTLGTGHAPKRMGHPKQASTLPHSSLQAKRVWKSLSSTQCGVEGPQTHSLVVGAITP